MLPKTSAYVNRCGGETKWMYFFIEEKHNGNWNKVNNTIKKNRIANLSKIKNF